MDEKNLQEIASYIPEGDRIFRGLDIIISPQDDGEVRVRVEPIYDEPKPEKPKKQPKRKTSRKAKKPKEKKTSEKAVKTEKTATSEPEPMSENLTEEEELELEDIEWDLADLEPLELSVETVKSSSEPTFVEVR